MLPIYKRWKSGRAADCTCLENRNPFAGIVGSNPTSSEIKNPNLKVGVFIFLRTINYSSLIYKLKLVRD